MLAVGEFDAFGRGHEHHLVGVFCGLLLHRVDQFQRFLGVMALVQGWLNPYGKELRAQVSLARRLQVKIPAIQRLAQVEVLVKEALGRVGMRVDHDGRAVYGFGRKFGGHFGGRLGTRRLAVG